MFDWSISITHIRLSIFMIACIKEEVVCHKSNADGLTIDDSSCNLCSGAHLRMKDWIFCWNGAGISGIRPVLKDANRWCSCTMSWKYVWLHYSGCQSALCDREYSNICMQLVSMTSSNSTLYIGHHTVPILVCSMLYSICFRCNFYSLHFVAWMDDWTVDEVLTLASSPN